MKLINFNYFEPFKEIRKKLEIEDGYIPNFKSSKAIIQAQKWQEVKTRGLDISIDELEEYLDGTLEHQDFPGEKMMVYIRDSIQSKYHISWCATLKTMATQGRYSRYVVSQRTDGIFLLDKVENGRVLETRESKLEICKNCLSRLNYSGYSSKSNYDKEKIVKNFLIKDFLEEYNTQILYEPDEIKNKVKMRIGDIVNKNSFKVSKEDCSIKIAKSEETIFKKEMELNDSDYFTIKRIKEREIYEEELREILKKKFGKVSPMLNARIEKINKKINETLEYENFIEIVNFLGNMKYKINLKYRDIEV